MLGRLTESWTSSRRRPVNIRFDQYWCPHCCLVTIYNITPPASSTVPRDTQNTADGRNARYSRGTSNNTSTTHKSARPNRTPIGRQGAGKIVPDIGIAVIALGVTSYRRSALVVTVYGVF